MALDKPYADVPGTTIFDAQQARKGYHLNQFCMSLIILLSMRCPIAIFFCDGQSFEQAAASMTGVSSEEYRKMMLGGGRSPAGNLYKGDKANG